MATSKKAVSAKPAAKKSATPAKNSEAKTPAAKPSMPQAVFNIDEINELLKAVNKANVNELKLEKGDFKVTIRQGAVSSGQAQVVHMAAPQVAHPAPQAAAPLQAAAQAPPPAAADSGSDNLITIKSPMIGTFYRASGPGKPTFVNVGDEVKVGQVLCIVEAMKLFNEIESEVSGRIVKVLADDMSPVEYDQPLFLVEP